MKRLLLLTALLCSASSLFAQQRSFIRPPYLQRGDTVGIVAPAHKLSAKADTAKVRERIESWGLHVRFGGCLMDSMRAYFAGSDSMRAADLQAMIDNPNIRAIICYQGGYGSVRLLPLLDFTPLQQHPKWLVGFSDITMLHLALAKAGIESLHATMPCKFRFDDKQTPEAAQSDSTLRVALFGGWSRLDIAPDSLNRFGTARGRLAGGNLSILCSAIGTPETPDFDEPTVLFIEDVGEPLYRIDRMMQQIARCGWLEKCTAVLVGHFSAMSGQKQFGAENAYQIIDKYTRNLHIPVVYDVPAGHIDPNVALYLGREVTVRSDKSGARVEF